MREDLPSVTAIYVTFARAAATRDRELSKACSDPCAERLLPRALLPLLEGAGRSRLIADGVRRFSLGMCDHIALRTALIDAALDHAMIDHQEHAERTPVEQVVILGAGFDARGHRMHALSKAVLFEVDHPATQKLKRKKARALPVAAREIRYASCDFQRTRIEEALAAQGFDASKRTVWIWEGVTMYLPPTGVVSSLQTISNLSAPDSLLIMTYVTPDLVAGGALLGHYSAKLLGLVSEPIHFARNPDEIGQMLRLAHFEALSDASPNDAAPHFGVHVKRPTSLMPSERIVVAIKQGERP